MKYYRPAVLFLIIVSFFVLSAHAWTGKVVGVSDGDIIKVLHGGKPIKIRLYGIDTPEKDQSFGRKAKKYTINMAANKMVNVEAVDNSMYGGIVALVTVYGKSLNKELVRKGYAWVSRDYCQESFCSEWLKKEDIARKAKAGLWIEPYPVPPWEWRNIKRGKTKPSPAFLGGSGTTFQK